MVLTRRQGLDIADDASVEAAFRRFTPWAVVNAAGLAPTLIAEVLREHCWRDNVEGVEVLARICGKAGVPLVIFSSDRVFDGAAERPYVESDPVSPDGIFGESKAEAERRAEQLHQGTLIIRSGPFISPWVQQSFLSEALRCLAEGRQVRASDCGLISPAYLPDLVHAALDLLLDMESGIWHAANCSADTPYELVRRAARAVGLDTSPLIRSGERRMRVLSSKRGTLLPRLEAAVERWARDSEPLWREGRAG